MSEDWWLVWVGVLLFWVLLDLVVCFVVCCLLFDVSGFGFGLVVCCLGWVDCLLVGLVVLVFLLRMWLLLDA